MPVPMSLSGPFRTDVPESGHLYHFCYELQLAPPPGQLAVFGQVSVPARTCLWLYYVSYGMVRSIDHSEPMACTFSIDASFTNAPELYTDFYAGCLNLDTPSKSRMIFNSHCSINDNREHDFGARGLPLLGGSGGVTYSWKIKNEDPMHQGTGDMVILGEWAG